MRVFFRPQIAAVCFAALSLVPMAAASAHEPKPGQNQPDVPRLINDLADPDDEAAEKAILSLGKVGLACVDPLFRAFEKSDNLTRTRVVQVLGLLRHTAIKENRDALSVKIEDLLVKALDDSHLPVIGYSAMALSFKEPRSRKAIPVLISNMRREQRKDDKADVISGSASLALRRYGPDAAEGIPVFLDILSNTKNAEWRRASAGVALASVAPKDPRTIATLTRTVRNDKERLEFRTQVASIMVCDPKDGAQGIMGDVFGLLEATTDKPQGSQGSQRGAKPTDAGARPVEANEKRDHVPCRPFVRTERGSICANLRCRRHRTCRHVLRLHVALPNSRWSNARPRPTRLAFAPSGQ